MKIIEGNLLDLAESGHFDVIVHGCNCFHTMGSGIARQLADRYPEVPAADRLTVRGDPNKLGTYSVAQVSRNGNTFFVVNAYTQFRYGRDKIHADVGAIERAFTSLAKQFPEARIGYPRIGAGLAGGDWSEIAPKIASLLSGHSATLVEYAPSPSPRRTQP